MYWTHPLVENRTYGHDLSTLEEFMFTKNEKEKISRPVKSKPNESHESHENENDRSVTSSPILSVSTITQPSNHVSPLNPGDLPLNFYDLCKLRAQSVRQCQDPLFWTLYLAHYGKSEYERIGGCVNGNVEMNTKNEIVECMKKKGVKHWNSVLNCKMTKVKFMELCEEVLTLPRISWKHLYLFCGYFECNIHWLDLQTNIYMQFLYDGVHDNNYVLFRNTKKGPQYWVDCEEQVIKIRYIEDKFVSILNYDKPFKAASNYKLSDLESISRRLKIDFPQKMKKQELYNKIMLHCGNEQIIK